MGTFGSKRRDMHYAVYAICHLTQHDEELDDFLDQTVGKMHEGSGFGLSSGAPIRDLSWSFDTLDEAQVAVTKLRQLLKEFMLGIELIKIDPSNNGYHVLEKIDSPSSPLNTPKDVDIDLEVSKKLGNILELLTGEDPRDEADWWKED